jgi:hypothetical protein
MATKNQPAMDMSNALGDLGRELARKAYEKVLDDMKDLAEIARMSQADAMAKITQRGTEHLDEVKKMMKLS